MRHEAFVKGVFENARELMAERSQCAQSAYERYEFGDVSIKATGDWLFGFDDEQRPMMTRTICYWSETFKSRPQQAQFVVAFEPYSTSIQDAYALSARQTRFGFLSEEHDNEIAWRM